MTAGSWFSPASANAGSPGRSCCIAKISSDTSNRVGPISATRRNSQAPIPYRRPHPTRVSLDPQSLRPDQPVGVGTEPGHLSAHRIEPFRMPQIDDRPVGEHPLRDLRIMREALRPIAGRPRSRQLAIDLGVAVARRYSARAAPRRQQNYICCHRDRCDRSSRSGRPRNRPWRHDRARWRIRSPRS